MCSRSDGCARPKELHNALNETLGLWFVFLGKQTMMRLWFVFLELVIYLACGVSAVQRMVRGARSAVGASCARSKSTLVATWYVWIRFSCLQPVRRRIVRAHASLYARFRCCGADQSSGLLFCSRSGKAVRVGVCGEQPGGERTCEGYACLIFEAICGFDQQLRCVFVPTALALIRIVR